MTFHFVTPLSSILDRMALQLSRISPYIAPQTGDQQNFQTEQRSTESGFESLLLSSASQLLSLLWQTNEARAA